MCVVGATHLLNIFRKNRLMKINNKRTFMISKKPYRSKTLDEHNKTLTLHDGSIISTNIIF